MHAYRHKHTHTLSLSLSLSHTHKHTHKRTHTHKHTHTHTHTSTHTHILFQVHQDIIERWFDKLEKKMSSHTHSHMGFLSTKLNSATKYTGSSRAGPRGAAQGVPRYGFSDWKRVLRLPRCTCRRGLYYGCARVWGRESLSGSEMSVYVRERAGERESEREQARG